jgi:hypothetical protein
MKKVLLLFSLLSTLFLFSCQKEVSEVPSNDDFNFKIENFGNGPTRFWYDVGDDGFGCYPDGKDCFDDVVITPENFTAHAATEGNNIVAEFLNDLSKNRNGKSVFLKNQALLERYVGKNIVDAIRKNELSVEFKGKDLGKGIYLILRYKGGVYGVFPLKDKAINSKAKTK